MDRRQLGSTGFEVAPLAFGGNVFGWTVDEAMSFELLDAFVCRGARVIHPRVVAAQCEADDSDGGLRRED